MQLRLPSNLQPCLGVTSDVLKDLHSSDSDSDSAYQILVPGDENEIPNWFNHQRVGNLISFSIGPEFPTIALCIAFHIEGDFPDMDCFYYFHINVDISINGRKRSFRILNIPSDTRYGNLCFLRRRLSQKLFQDLNLGDQNHVELLCETFACGPYQPFLPNIKRIGVHVECNCPQPQNGEAFNGQL